MNELGTEMVDENQKVDMVTELDGGLSNNDDKVDV